MERINLGEFEELVLLLVAVLNGQAYGISTMAEMEGQTGRKVNISAVHAALRRLETKGFVESKWSEATKARGGRRKRLFEITQKGSYALAELRAMRDKLWNQIPNLGTQFSLR